MRLPQPTPLHWALLVSLLLHGVLATVHFAEPQALHRMFRDAPLEVILVNARSNEAPEKPQAIAQVHLQGGGDAERGRATSPLPPAPELALGDDLQDERRRVEALRAHEQALLAQLRRELATLPPPDPRRETATPEERERQERYKQLLRQLAEIEKRVNEDNAGPRRRYISPATREAVYALYYDQLRRRIEDRGTRDFPQHNGQKLYGELTMNVTVDAAGRVVAAEVVRPSASRLLDQRALAIVHAASPFGAFSPAMRAQADQIVVTSRFRFTRDDALATTLSSQ
jgi:protein TonB